MKADKTLLPKSRQGLLDFPLDSLGHGGDVFTLIQEMGNDPVQICTIGAKDLHMGELFY